MKIIIETGENRRQNWNTLLLYINGFLSAIQRLKYQTLKFYFCKILIITKIDKTYIMLLKTYAKSVSKIHLLFVLRQASNVHIKLNKINKSTKFIPTSNSVTRAIIINLNQKWRLLIRLRRYVILRHCKSICDSL